MVKITHALWPRNSTSRITVYPKMLPPSVSSSLLNHSHHHILQITESLSLPLWSDIPLLPFAKLNLLCRISYHHRVYFPTWDSFLNTPLSGFLSPLPLRLVACQGHQCSLCGKIQWSLLCSHLSWPLGNFHTIDHSLLYARGFPDSIFSGLPSCPSGQSFSVFYSLFFCSKSYKCQSLCPRPPSLHLYSLL